MSASVFTEKFGSVKFSNIRRMAEYTKLCLLDILSFAICSVMTDSLILTIKSRNKS